MITVRYKGLGRNVFGTSEGGIRLAGLAAAIENLLHQLCAIGTFEIELCAAAPVAGFDAPYLLVSRCDRPTMVVKFWNPRLGEREVGAFVGGGPTLAFDYAVFDSGANMRQNGTCTWSRLLAPISFVVAVEDEQLVATGGDGL